MTLSTLEFCLSLLGKGLGYAALIAYVALLVAHPRYAIYLLASWGVTLLVVFFAPLIALAVRPDGTLPRGLRWAGTSDNNQDGDAGHLERWAGKSVYARRVAWLWRNPAYVFEERVLGAQVSGRSYVCFDGDPRIKNRVGAKAGTLAVQVFETSRPVWWCWKRVTRPFWDGETCLMLEFGWKLQPYAQSRAKLEPAHRAQFVFSIRLTAFLPAGA